MRRGLLLVLLTLVITLAACGDTGTTRPNVLLLTLDTVRADHLGTYGYARPTSPNLDRLASRGVVFENAIANSSFTPPSHASLLTALYPAEHGLTFWSERLADVPTAAERFSAAGYRTLAVTPLPTLLQLGLDRGFEHTVGLAPEQDGDLIRIRDAVAVNGAALPWLTESDDRPFFAWVHYYDAHRPFGRQGPEWAHRFSDYPDDSVGSTEADYNLTPYRRGKRDLDDEQVTFIKDRYDGGLAWLDARVDELLAGLEQAGALEDTIVVVTADHGEVLDEHDESWFAHDPYLFEGNVHVPLIVRLPADVHAGRRVDGLVQGVDVLPTLLELAGLDAADADAFSGRSLVPLIEGRALPPALVYAERRGKDPGPDIDGEEERARSLDRKRMVRTDTHKLIQYVDRDRYELFRVDDEHTDLSSVARDESAALRDALLRMLAEMRVAQGSGADGIDPETLELLRQLGYIDD